MTRHDKNASAIEHNTLSPSHACRNCKIKCSVVFYSHCSRRFMLEFSRTRIYQGAKFRVDAVPISRISGRTLFFLFLWGPSVDMKRQEAKRGLRSPNSSYEAVTEYYGYVLACRNDGFYRRANRSVADNYAILYRREQRALAESAHPARCCRAERSARR